MSTHFTRAHFNLFTQLATQGGVHTHTRSEEKSDGRLGNKNNKEGFFSTARGKAGGKKTAKKYGAFRIKHRK